MFVGDIAMGYRVASQTTYQVGGRVPIYDEKLQPVGGATVTVEATLPDGQTLTRSADTRSNGVALFSGFSSQEGIYTLTVLDVQADGYVYDPDRNLETSEQLQVP